MFDMESILAKALESTLRYWLNSFQRDQFRLQGRTVQLSNLDINGDALHASAGFPPALEVTQARVRKLEIKLPSVSNVQVEPIVVQIDRLDLVLTEKADCETAPTLSRSNSSVVSKNSGYGFADKIADGTTLQVETVNLMLETRGSISGHAGATWTPPLASITIRNLLLYTTNEHWQVVSLKEAREFSSNKKYIYVFKKLEWESLSVDLLPHPDMFKDEHLMSLSSGESKRDDDGAKRLFFGGERFIENISGEAYITIQRTEQNNPLGLEVQLHLPEAVCPSLSEPGLRALLRFLTGVYVCLNRGDLGRKIQQKSTAAASSSFVAVIVDHIFLGIEDVEFKLELSMQSLHFSRASVSDGELTKTLTRVMLRSLFLRDTFSERHCTLVQPSMQNDHTESQPVPHFANEKLWSRIYPLGPQHWQVYEGTAMVCLYSLQINPSPAPPAFASQTVVMCQPVKISLQEESCLRIMSFLADGIVVNPGDVLPDTSVNHFYFSIRELNLSIPINSTKLSQELQDDSLFTGARLHVESFIFLQSPSVSFKLLNIEKDPACFTLWKGQPVDASQRKWVMRASCLSLSLETENNIDSLRQSLDVKSSLWHCVELYDPCIEAAMVTPDGSPLVVVPPPGGVVRMALACKSFVSNTSVEQLFFVLKLYTYLGRVGEDILKVPGGNREIKKQWMEHKDNSDINKTDMFSNLVETVPSDTAVIVSVDNLQLQFLESSSSQIDHQGSPLVHFSGVGLNIKVGHRTLGGAMVISSMICWESIQIDCIETEFSKSFAFLESSESLGSMVKFTDDVDHCPEMHAVLWIDDSQGHIDKNIRLTEDGFSKSAPFLEVDVVHVLPYKAQDAECHSLTVKANIAGVRLGGGMNYVESLLHRFGILGSDGRPGEGLQNILNNLSKGPLAKLLKSSPHTKAVGTERNASIDVVDDPSSFELTSPDDIKIDIRLKDWLFALEGVDSTLQDQRLDTSVSIPRLQRCWHVAFQSINVYANSKEKSTSYDCLNDKNIQKQHPLDSLKVGVERIKILKPEALNSDRLSCKSKNFTNDFTVRENGSMQYHGLRGKQATAGKSGVDFEVQMKISESDFTLGMGEWVVDSMRFTVKDPVEAKITKEELDYLVLLSKSEIKAFSRITVGILQILQLHNSLGQATMDQLSHIGIKSLDKIIASEMLPQERSTGNGSYILPDVERFKGSQNTTRNILEKSLSNSQDICDILRRKLVQISEESNAIGTCIADVEALSDNLEKIRTLLSNYHTDT